MLQFSLKQFCSLLQQSLKIFEEFLLQSGNSTVKMRTTTSFPSSNVEKLWQMHTWDMENGSVALTSLLKKKKKKKDRK